MDKKKVIPIALILIFLIIIFVMLYQRKKDEIHFNQMEVSFNDKVQTYDKLKIDDKFTINGYAFLVVSVNKKEVVLKSVEYINNENEFSIKLDEDKRICFTENNCANLVLR